MTEEMPDSARQLLEVLVDIENQAVEEARMGGCRCSGPMEGTDRDYPAARFDRQASLNKPYNEIEWQTVHLPGCPMDGHRGIGYASEPKCGELSPESGRPCFLLPGHRGAHVTWLGPASIASWAPIVKEGNGAGH